MLTIDKLDFISPQNLKWKGGKTLLFQYIPSEGSMTFF